MKVSCVMVMSLDGRTTYGDTVGANGWASLEDQQFFREEIAETDCVIMGSATYDAARSHIIPDPKKPRIILTRDLDKYSEDSVREGLFFSDQEPAEVLAAAKEMKANNVLVAGGAVTNSRFLEAGLIDEIFVTVEPIIFGSGKPLVEAISKQIHLRLLSVKQLNEQGTALLHYHVEKDKEAA